MIDLLNEPTLSAMSHYLDRLSQRQKIIASNIANLDTPGYKTKEVPFNATMAELMSGPEPAAAAGARASQARPWPPEVFPEPGLPERPDQNNVDIDREMLKLGQTSGRFGLITQLLSHKFRTLSSSINEGRVG